MHCTAFCHTAAFHTRGTHIPTFRLHSNALPHVQYYFFQFCYCKATNHLNTFVICGQASTSTYWHDQIAAMLDQLIPANVRYRCCLPQNIHSRICHSSHHDPSHLPNLLANHFNDMQFTFSLWIYMVQIHDAQSLDYICLSLASLQGFLIVNVMRDSWQCIPVWSERVGVQFHAWKCVMCTEVCHCKFLW